MRHIMLDIETLGIKPGCIVLSIGAVEFDHTGITKEFIVHIDPQDAERCGLSAEAGTVMWWLSQSKEAQDALSTGTPRALQGALIDLVHAFDWNDVKVWCNGASFDFPILQAAFAAVGMKAPWAYYNEMDFRTLKNFYSKSTFKRMQVQPELAHDALEDARAQALTTGVLLANFGDALQLMAA